MVNGATVLLRGIMLHSVRMNFSIWRLRKRRKKYFDLYCKLAQNENSKDAYEAMLEYQRTERELQGFETAFVVYRLSKYGIPMPALDDKEAWATTEDGLRIFSTKGFYDTRSMIREEANQRWQYWDIRLKVVVALLVGLTGAFGALIGLIATLRH